MIQNFYHNITGKYWDAERRHLDEGYQTVPFPFEALKTPHLSMVFKWQRDELEGYLNSWSSIQHFKKANGYNPIPNLMLDLEAFWGEFERKSLYFPVFMKIGKVVK